MAFVPLPGEREEVAARGASGQRGQVFPEGPGEVPLLLPGCMSCPKKEAHGEPCQELGFEPAFGEERGDRLGSGERIDRAYLRRIQGALWMAGFTANGHAGEDSIFNLGPTANNLVQGVTYEVVAVGGDARRVQLRGPDPRRIVVGVSRVNPMWPLPDPETGSTARLVVEGRIYRLAVGSVVRFAFPSVLYRKCTPWIEDVEPPSGPVGEGDDPVTFWVVLSRTARHARDPYDAAFPPDKYYCRVQAYLIEPEVYGFEDEGPEAQFAEVELEVPAASATAGGGEPRVELENSAGGGCRVLLPGVHGDVVKVDLLDDEDPAVVVGTVASPVVTTEDTGSGWRSWLELEGVDLEGVETIRVRYWAEAVDGDERLVNVRGRCRESQPEASGHADDNGFSCRNTECEKYHGEHGGFRAECWDTRASGFRLEGLAGAHPAGDFDRALLGRYWTRENVGITQGIPGSASSRNFWFFRPSGGGTSLQQLLGSRGDPLPDGPGSPSTTSAFGAPMGQRRVYTDAGGVLRQELVRGLFEAVRIDYDGAMTEHVAGWGDREDCRGQPMDAVNGLYPSCHGPSMDLDGRTTGPDPSGWFAWASDFPAGDQVHVTAAGRDRVVPSVAAAIRAAVDG